MAFGVRGQFHEKKNSDLIMIITERGRWKDREEEVIEVNWPLTSCNFILNGVDYWSLNWSLKDSSKFQGITREKPQEMGAC